MPEWTAATGTIHYEILEPSEPSSIEPPSLTLLHNFMSTGRAAWGLLLDKLARRHRILLPDMPGHGRSRGYPAGFHHGALAEQISELMTAVGFDQGHLAGCSSGGMVAQLLVHHGMVQPQSLTLISTTFSTNPQTTGNTAKLVPEEFQAGARWMEATARLHDPHHYVGYYEEVLLPGFRDLGAAQTIDLPLTSLQSWHFPVALIHGEDDEFFPLTIPQRMVDVLPQGELHVMPGQPHALIFRQPQKVADVMVNFLDGYREG